MNPSLSTLARLAGTALAAASLCGAVMAQIEPTPTPHPTEIPVADADGAKPSHHEKGFLKKAAKGGMKEVAVSQAVMDHLVNPKVRAFAQQMVTDHTAANNELASVAASKGVELPVLDPDVAEDWSKKSGDVDKKYVKEMVSDHEEAVKLFKKAAESTDPEIAAFAQKTLPTLEHHLMMVQDLSKTVD